MDPKRVVNCQDCDVSGRVDNIQKHFKKIIVWSKSQEGEAAEECEGKFKSAPKEAKQLASDKVKKFNNESKHSAFR